MERKSMGRKLSGNQKRNGQRERRWDRQWNGQRDGNGETICREDSPLPPEKKKKSWAKIGSPKILSKYPTPCPRNKSSWLQSGSWRILWDQPVWSHRISQESWSEPYRGILPPPPPRPSSTSFKNRKQLIRIPQTLISELISLIWMCCW